MYDMRRRLMAVNIGVETNKVEDGYMTALFTRTEFVQAKERKRTKTKRKLPYLYLEEKHRVQNLP